MNNLSTDPMNPIFGKTGSRYDKKDKLTIYANLEKKHRLEFLQRFQWNNLPEGWDPEWIETVLYARYKGAFFKYADTYHFLPVALNGTIDSMGRYEYVKPVLLNGQYDDKKKKYEDIPFLPSTVSNQAFKVAYGKFESLKSVEPAIMLKDFSSYIAQEEIPEAFRSHAILERMVNTLSLIEMTLINGVQTYTFAVDDEEQKDAAEQILSQMDQRTLEGKRFNIIVKGAGTTSLQELTNAKGIADANRYWQSYTNFDNLRKSTIGISNSGTTQKVEHVTEMEQEYSADSGDAIMENALMLRKRFCELVNYYYPELNISVEENVEEIDNQTPTEGTQSRQAEGEIE